MTPILLCLVIAVPDGDTLRCQTGERIRIAGIDANEMSGRCHNQCAAMPAVKARDYLARRTMGRTVSFRLVGRSGKRLVGENAALRCDLVRQGAAVRWVKWERRYGLEPCSG